MAHHRHLNRIHQRRRRTTKTSSKLLRSNTSGEKGSQSFNKIVERQRFNSARTPKLVLHQPSRSNH